MFGFLGNIHVIHPNDLIFSCLEQVLSLSDTARLWSAFGINCTLGSQRSKITCFRPGISDPEGRLQCRTKTASGSNLISRFTIALCALLRNAVSKTVKELSRRVVEPLCRIAFNLVTEAMCYLGIWGRDYVADTGVPRHTGNPQ